MPPNSNYVSTISSTEDLPALQPNLNALGPPTNVFYGFRITYSYQGEHSVVLVPTWSGSPWGLQELPFGSPPIGSSPTLNGGFVDQQLTADVWSASWTVNGQDFQGGFLISPTQPIGPGWVIEASTPVTVTVPSFQPSLALCGPPGNSQGAVGVAVLPNGTVVLGWADAETSAITLCLSSYANISGPGDWQSPLVLPETSQEGVDLSYDAVNNVLYVAWTGTDGALTPNVAQVDVDWVTGTLSYSGQKGTSWGQSAVGAVSVDPLYYVNAAGEWECATTMVAWTGTDGPPGSINTAGAPELVISTETQLVFSGQNSSAAPRTTYIPDSTPDGGQGQQVITWAGTDAAGSLNVLVVQNTAQGPANQFIISPVTPAASAPAILYGNSPSPDVTGAFGEAAPIFMAWVDQAGALNLTSLPPLFIWDSQMVAFQTTFWAPNVGGLPVNAPASGATVTLKYQPSYSSSEAGDSVAVAHLLIAYTNSAGSPLLAKIPADPSQW